MGGDDYVNEAIDEAESEVLEDWGNPLKKSTFWILESDTLKFEFRPNNKPTHRIDKVLIRDSSNSTQVYTEGTPGETSHLYSKDFDDNSITFAQDTIDAHQGERVEVEYVPKPIHYLVRNKAALFILSRVNDINQGENTPIIIINILSRIKRLEAGLATTNAVGSNENIAYDPTYGEQIAQRRFKVY